ncbi:MAG: lipoprotein-releasing system permease protein [Tenuifilum sp.]|jgi:lipoprotein-releasing system permease protein|uniref:FtsX-like permease family protein n=1 Tax=Tenuifilum sp. TaxID=2760880 RepID=UPI0024AB41B8|nr:FtsX-like permease family protein [Tenuifilum sp.]MDI3526782.1 lipoprotein-releasing system permease protein [Tenuifilum sp.]
MNVPLYIARRYLFAKKSHNIINIISIISVIGVATGVMALVVVLSVFNGFDTLIANLYSHIDADLKIVPQQGKTFRIDSLPFKQIKELPEVSVFAEVVEENALFRYRGRQHIGIIKGVSRNYTELSGLGKKLKDGEFKLWRGSQPLAIMGEGVAYYLNASLAHFDPLFIYLPRRGRSYSPTRAFNKKAIMPSGIFAIEQDFDTRYVFTPIEFARNLLMYDSVTVNAIEIKLIPDANPEKVKNKVQSILGGKYRILNRYQQNESLYRTMKSEKFAIALILTLILIIASFNIVGSLSMLIIDKRADVETLKSLGASNKLIQKIFLFEGMLISIGGSLIGIVLGLITCWLQITFKIIRLEGRGNFIIDAYPVDVQPLDITLIFFVVVTIGYLAARFPVRLITKRILQQ